MNIVRHSICVSSVMLTSADLQRVIQRILDEQIEIRNIHRCDDLTVVMDIKASDVDAVRHIADKLGAVMSEKRISGPGIYISRLFTRPVLTAGLFLLFLLGWFLTTRVIVVEVEGNVNIPSRKILESASECGIRFGAGIRSVRSEEMKNKLLEHIPELRWAGVNTYGSRAVISVREKSENNQTTVPKVWESIVADRDGVILSCTVTSGTAAVVPGQAVSKGQVLISGVGEDPLKTYKGYAEGEVMALTRRELKLKYWGKRSVRRLQQEEKGNYSLIIGKKRINFYKGSGISDASCVKMYSEYVLTLPGGIALPVRFQKEILISCNLQEKNLWDEQEVSEFACAYLRGQMIAGTVIGVTEELTADGSCLVLSGIYECQEMIGRVKPGEIGVYHGKTD